jgi:hypothetical protein
VNPRVASMDFRLRVILWTPALAYEGFLLSGGSTAAPAQIATVGFLGGSLGFLLATMFTIRQGRRKKVRLRR